MIHPKVETTSEKAVKPAHTKRWLKLRTGRWIDDKSIWMFIDGSSSGWHAAVILDPFANTLTRVAKFQKPKSSNIGPELWSLLIGLKVVDPTKPLTVVHDYMGTGAWLVGAWKIKSLNVREAIGLIKTTMWKRDFTSIRFIHHGGHQKDDTDFTRWNNEADKLCNNQQVVHTTVDWDGRTEGAEVMSSNVVTSSPEPVIELTDGQKKAIELLGQGRNVFLTGVAGTGKTLILNTWLSDPTTEDVAVTASTGIAATHLGGQTIHSWSGCGIGDRPAGKIVESYYWKMNVKPVIRATKALVIDEISMLDGKMFQMVDVICQVARRCRAPFGGLQVVLVGDMGQLSPVEEGLHGFVFETPTWKELGLQNIVLTKVMRQHDEDFIRVLNGVRKGDLDAAAFEMLDSRVGVYDPDKADACRLMTHRAQVEEVNNKRLSELPGRRYTYKSMDSGVSDYACERLDKSCLSPKTLVLKVGARVILTKNGKGYVNGSMGTVKRLGNVGSPIVVELDNGRELALSHAVWKITKMSKRTNHNGDAELEERILASRSQYPLCLAWAITIHKCVYPNTLMEVPEGLLPISDVPEEGRTASFEKGWHAYRNKVRNPSMPGLRVMTKRGYEIMVTPDHKLMAHYPGGNKFLPIEASSLGCGDYVRLVRGSPQLGWCQDMVADSNRFEPKLPPKPEADVRVKTHNIPERLTEHLATFFGLMVADGMLYRRGFRLAKRHGDVTAKFASLCKELFGVDPKLDEKCGAYFAEVNSTYLATWLGYVGGMEPKAKAVPRSVMGSTPSVQRAFLHGLFADGSAHVKKGAFSHIEWSTRCKRMSLVVQVMLLRLGIAASRRRTVRVTRKGNERESWCLWIYGLDAARFRECIGFPSAFKQARLATAGGRHARMGRSLDSREVVDTIDRIEMVGTIPTMCVEVPNTGRFVQNGFDGSNSQGMTLDKVSANLANCFSAGQAYVALSRARSLEGLNIEAWNGHNSIIASPKVRSFLEVCAGTEVSASTTPT